MSNARRLSLGLLIALGLGLYVAMNFRVTTAITHFMPSGADARLARISELLASGEQTRSMVLSISGEGPAQVLPAARALANALQKRSELAWLRAGVPDDLGEQVYQLYFPRRYQFASDQPGEIRTLLSDSGLRDSARRLKRELASPLGPMVRQLASADPLRLFSHQLARIEAARSSKLRPEGDQLVSADGKRAFLFAATRASAFDTERQRALFTYLDAQWMRIRRELGTPVTLGVSSLARFALASERVIRSDIQRVSSISLIGTALLFVWMFRSLRYLVLGLVPLLFGTLCACSLCLWWFGELHGLTLAFGSSLIGVCVDYAVHYFNHYSFDTESADADASLRRIWPALFMGGLTSAIGFAGLAFSSFPGIREIAVFSAVGVLTALLAMRAFVPPLLPHPPRPSPAQARWAALLERGFSQLLSRPSWHWAPAVIALALSIAGLPRVRWVDDLRALLPSDPRLLAESERVREQVSAMDAGRFVIASGSSFEQALQHNDCVAPRLMQAERAGFLQAHQSLHAWLWSSALQASNRAAIVGSAELGQRVQQAYATEGFTASAFDDFASSLHAPDPGPLTFEALRASGLGPLISNFVVRDREQVLILNFLQNVKNPRALERSVSACQGVVYFDQTAFLTGVYTQFRQRVVQLIGVGLLAVFLMVYSHYRRVSLSLAAFLPAVLAGCATAAVLWLVHGALTLLHAVALLLVLAMGVDYGIFLAESNTVRGGIGPTLLSLVIACLGTILSFGLLALSVVPALRAIGETTALGTLLSLALAPTVMLALRALETKS